MEVSKRQITPALQVFQEDWDKKKKVDLLNGSQSSGQVSRYQFYRGESFTKSYNIKQYLYEGGALFVDCVRFTHLQKGFFLILNMNIVKLNVVMIFLKQYFCKDIYSRG